jgi:dienelactone hydrolase
VVEILPDIHRAVRFIRVHAEEYGVDPDRLGIMGPSSGGFFALSIATAGKPGDQERMMCCGRTGSTNISDGWLKSPTRIVVR